jgi:hypothetical protein
VPLPAPIAWGGTGSETLARWSPAGSIWDNPGVTIDEIKEPGRFRQSVPGAGFAYWHVEIHDGEPWFRNESWPEPAWVDRLQLKYVFGEVKDVDFVTSEWVRMDGAWKRQDSSEDS